MTTLFADKMFMNYNFSLLRQHSINQSFLVFCQVCHSTVLLL